MASPTKYDALVSLTKELQRCERASLKATAARAALPPGSTRARVTTANARWRTAAEARDRAFAELREHVAGSLVCPSLALIAAQSPVEDKQGTSVYVGNRLRVDSDVAWVALESAKVL